MISTWLLAILFSWCITPAAPQFQVAPGLCAVSDPSYMGPVSFVVAALGTTDRGSSGIGRGRGMAKLGRQRTIVHYGKGRGMKKVGTGRGQSKMGTGRGMAQMGTGRGQAHLGKGRGLPEVGIEPGEEPVGPGQPSSVKKTGSSRIPPTDGHPAHNDGGAGDTKSANAADLQRANTTRISFARGAEVYIDAGDKKMRAGDYDGAASDYYVAQNAEGFRGASNLRMACAQIARQRYYEGANCLLHYAEAKKSIPIKGFCMPEDSRIEQEIDRRVRWSPQDTNYLLSAAVYALSRNQAQDALKTVEQLRTVDPRHPCLDALERAALCASQNEADNDSQAP